MKVAPQTLMAERNALASALIDPLGADRVCEYLSPGDFQDPTHALIFATIQALTRDRKACGPAEVIESVSRHGVSPELVLDLAQGTIGSHSHAGRYAKIVLESSQLRRIAALSLDTADIATKAAAIDGSVLDVLEVLREGIDAIVSRFPGRGPIQIAQAEPDLLRRILNDERTPQGIPTGFYDIDDQLGGLRNGEMIVLAARPSVGKSLLACNIAENIATSDRECSVLVFSLEMSAASLYRRALFGRAGVSASIALDGIASREDKDRLRTAHSELRNARLDVQADSNLTAQRVQAAARRFKARYGHCVIVLDYLQLMQGEGKGRYEQVTRLSAAMKAIAVDLDVPVLVLSQLNRNAAETRDLKGDVQMRTPTLADLRDSGAIEQDADVVLFLSRDIAQQTEHTAKVSIAKNRPGRCGETQILFDTNGPRFKNYARVQQFPRSNA